MKDFTYKKLKTFNLSLIKVNKAREFFDAEDGFDLQFNPRVFRIIYETFPDKIYLSISFFNDDDIFLRYSNKTFIIDTK